MTDARTKGFGGAIAVLLVVVGSLLALLGAGLPIGYAIAESTNLGLLIGAMIVLIGCGVGLIATAWALMKSPRHAHPAKGDLP